MSIGESLEKVLDTSDFTVGGGVASAIAASMAAGLAGMVARLSMSSPGKFYGCSDETYAQYIEELEKLREEEIVGAAADERAFLALKAAYGLSKSTSEERVARQGAIEKAAIEAAKVPERNAHRASRILEIIDVLMKWSNPNAASDLVCGRKLAAMAVSGALLNIKANLPLIKNEYERRALVKTLELLGDSEREYP